MGGHVAGLVNIHDEDKSIDDAQLQAELESISKRISSIVTQLKTESVPPMLLSALERAHGKVREALDEAAYVYDW